MTPEQVLDAALGPDDGGLLPCAWNGTGLLKPHRPLDFEEQCSKCGQVGSRP